MRHPSDAELALHAGGDLGWWQQRQTAKHLKQCSGCMETVVEFSALRPEFREFPGLPAELPAEMSWNRMALEMTANIRLGLEAGECVSTRSYKASGAGTRGVSWPRLAIACVVLLAIAGLGYLVQHPVGGEFGSRPVALAQGGSLLEASENGLQVRDSGQTLKLLNTSGKAVSRSVGSRGELGARYLDSNGYVTISEVYGQ